MLSPRKTRTSSRICTLVSPPTCGVPVPGANAVDPAFAPGTGTPQVGGLTSVQILELVRVLRGLNIVGCDLVEVSPPYDNGEITSLLAANLLFELLCVL